MRRSTRAHDSLDVPPPRAAPVRDALFSGQVGLWQPARGYRVNVDSLLLADFAGASRPRARHVVDLGAGVGAVTLAYAHLAALQTCTLLERETALRALAERNLAEKGLHGATIVLDLSEGLPSALKGVADVVVSNPPFFPEGSRAPRGTPRARARSGPLQPFLRAAALALGHRGYAFFAYPAPALPEILAAARDVGFVPKRLRLVHAFATSPARLALIEFRRAKPGGLVVDAPLVEWTAQGVRSPELETLVSGTRHHPLAVDH